jgi:hypothetical protein
MTGVKRSTMGFVLMLAATGAVNATTLFNFAGQSSTSGSGAMGDSLTMTVNGVTVTETAWYAANTTSTTKFQTAALDSINSSGLTVCSPTQRQGCAAASRQIDNSNGVEFVQVQFSIPVTLNSAQLYVYPSVSANAGDADMSFYTASTTLTTNTSIGSLGSATTINQNCTGSGGTACAGTTTTDSLSGTNVSYLLIAAAVTNTDGVTDDFSLASLTVTASVPEPASFEMFSLSAVLLGLAMWRTREFETGNPL